MNEKRNIPRMPAKTMPAITIIRRETQNEAKTRFDEAVWRQRRLKTEKAKSQKVARKARRSGGSLK